MVMVRVKPRVNEDIDTWAGVYIRNLDSVFTDWADKSQFVQREAVVVQFVGLSHLNLVRVRARARARVRVRVRRSRPCQP